jgi:ribosomal protein S18 acetylase RimI-like enzyme
MSAEFLAEPLGPGAPRADVAALAPANPFSASAYIKAMRAQGAQPWAFSLCRDGQPIAACPAFLRSGRLGRSLEIPSLPTLPDGDAFWGGLLRFCRTARVTDLEVNSLASTTAAIPTLGIETGRRCRSEYVLPLQGVDLWKAVRKGHKWGINRGRKAGLEVHRVDGEPACRDHVAAMVASQGRRLSRGEQLVVDTRVETYLGYLRAGAAELYQATLDGEVMSTAMILVAERGAYFHSAGTSPQGMDHGASPFLIHEVTKLLQARGFASFNLGGAYSDNEGLHAFKAGFGATRVDLESAEFYLGGRLRKKLVSAARLLRNDPGHFAAYLLGEPERYVLYTAETGEVPTPEPRAGVVLEKLSDEDLAGLPTGRKELREHVERFRRVGYNDAYAVSCDGKLAHISWLITPDHDCGNAVRNVKLRDGEAEITHCVTLPEFRGQGLYPYAIGHLCRVSRERGIRRIFMITNVRNRASQRGMEKAGLVRRGRITRWTFAYLPEHYGLTYRSHRWIGI